MTGNSDSSLLYTLYYDKVFGYIMNHIRNRAEAEDITSEVFLKLYSREEKIDAGRKGAATYVFKVTQSILHDHWRRNKFICAPLENLSYIDEEDDLDEKLVHLDRALENLSSREKEIVILHYYDGIGHKEIAEKMKLSHTNVRQICHTALKKLRRAIEEGMNGEERRGDVPEEDLSSVSGGLNLEYAFVSYPPDELDDAVDKSGCGRP